MKNKEENRKRECMFKRYVPSIEDVETYASLITALITTVLAMCFVPYSRFCESMDTIKAFLHCIIGGTMSLLGITISGVAIVVALFTVNEIRIINELSKDAFQVILDDFKFIAYHMAFGIVVLSFISFGEYFVCPKPICAALTYLSCFYVMHYLVFTPLYCAGLVKNCISLSSLKQKVSMIQSVDKDLFEQVNELISEELIAIVAKSHGFKIEEFYLDIIKRVDRKNVPNREKVIQYIRERYHL